MAVSAATATMVDSAPLIPNARNSTAPTEPAISTMQMTVNIAPMRNMTTYTVQSPRAGNDLPNRVQCP